MSERKVTVLILDKEAAGLEEFLSETLGLDVPRSLAEEMREAAERRARLEHMQAGEVCIPDDLRKALDVWVEYERKGLSSAHFPGCGCPCQRCDLARVWEKYR